MMRYVCVEYFTSTKPICAMNSDPLGHMAEKHNNIQNNTSYISTRTDL